MNTDNFKENIKINEQDKINQVYLEEVETDRTFNNKNNKKTPLNKGVLGNQLVVIMIQKVTMQRVEIF